MSVINRRPMRPADAPAAAAHLARSNFGYGTIDAEQHLPLLQSLLAENAVSGLLLEQEESGSSVIVALGVTGFLDLKLAQALLDTPPTLPVVEHLYAAERRGDRVLLRPRAIAKRNASDGLALIFLHFSLPQDDPNSADVQQANMLMQASFRLHHGGHHCLMALHPIPQTYHGADSLQAMGFQPVGDGKNLMWFDLANLDSIPFHPFASLRRMALPKLSFSPAEKSLLTLALWGRNDTQAAEDLDVSRETVRKRWRNIFRKIEEHPEINLFPEIGALEKEGRGQEKRGLVLQYIDAHMEEIRPYQTFDAVP